MTNHFLELAFSSDNPIYCLGFEAGNIYGQLKAYTGFGLECTIHTCNLLQYQAIAKTLNYVMTSHTLDEAFSVVLFLRACYRMS